MKQIDKVRELAAQVFHKRGPVKQGTWRGHRVIKYPTDLLTYAELIHELKPDFIIETGLKYGGSALFLADICRLNNKGKVISIEVDENCIAPKHTKLEVIYGDSTSKPVIDKVASKVGDKACLVILDSDHSKKHISAELEAYSQLVAVGGYIIAEDLYHDGGHQAVGKFLENHPEFELDCSVEKYGIHCAAGGFLKRVK